MPKTIKDLVEVIISEKLPAPLAPNVLRRLEAPLERLIGDLSQIQQEMVRERYGVGMRSHSRNKIGAKHQVTKGSVRYTEGLAMTQLRLYSPEQKAIREIVGLRSESNYYSIAQQDHILTMLLGARHHAADTVLRNFGTLKNIVDQYYKLGSRHVGTRMQSMHIQPRKYEKLLELFDFAEDLEGTPPAIPKMSGQEVMAVAKTINGMLSGNSELEVHEYFRPQAAAEQV